MTTVMEMLRKTLDGMEHCMPATIGGATLTCETCPYLDEGCETADRDMASLPVTMIEEIRETLQRCKEIFERDGEPAGETGNGNG